MIHTRQKRNSLIRRPDGQDRRETVFLENPTDRTGEKDINIITIGPDRQDRREGYQYHYNMTRQTGQERRISISLQYDQTDRTGEKDINIITIGPDRQDRREGYQYHYNRTRQTGQETGIALQ